MKKPIAAYLAFDNIYLAKEFAASTLDGWEHKEVVTPVFISVSYHDLEVLGNMTISEQVDHLASISPYLYDTFEQAEEEAAEENFYISNGFLP